MVDPKIDRSDQCENLGRMGELTGKRKKLEKKPKKYELVEV